MKQVLSILIALLALILAANSSSANSAQTDDDTVRLRELDDYWGQVSRAVREGDFEGYKATCHDGGVLVSGVKRTTQPLSRALVGWKQGFVDTKAGKMKASVKFRFSQRLGDSTTAHETGIFLYSSADSISPLPRSPRANPRQTERNERGRGRGSGGEHRRRGSGGEYPREWTVRIILPPLLRQPVGPRGPERRAWVPLREVAREAQSRGGTFAFFCLSGEFECRSSVVDLRRPC